MLIHIGITIVLLLKLIELPLIYFLGLRDCNFLVTSVIKFTQPVVLLAYFGKKRRTMHIFNKD